MAEKAPKKQEARDPRTSRTRLTTGHRKLQDGFRYHAGKWDDAS